MNFLLNEKTRNSKSKRNQRNRSNSRTLWFSVKRNVRFVHCYAKHVCCSGSYFTSKDAFSCDEEDYQGYPLPPSRHDVVSTSIQRLIDVETTS